nr:PASTA domain-containing protein [Sediminibacterium sp.]
YTIVVVIKNKPQAALFYGASVAGPVFKKIADRLYTSYVFGTAKATSISKLDSNQISFSGHKDDVTTLMRKLSLPVADQSGAAAEWITVQTLNKKSLLNRLSVNQNQVPILKGLGLKDAIYLCEEIGLQVKVSGRGKVVSQSLDPGTTVKKGNIIQLTLQP